MAFKLRKIATGELIDARQFPQHGYLGWDLSGTIIPDASGTLYEPLEVPDPVQSLTAMQFYGAFKLNERIAIKASTDPIVMEFWDFYQRAERTSTSINPTATSVVEGLEYLAGQALGGMTIATPILASEDRINQIRAGVAQ